MTDRFRPTLLAVAFTLAACSRGLPVRDFAATTPVLDPLAFFTGHTHSWGVLENRSGQPTAFLTTDGEGQLQDGLLHMQQRIALSDGTVQHRDWQLRRTSPGRYEATANDMVGTAQGEAAGRAFHWRFTIALSPGNALKNVGFEQWMFLMEDGTLVNRTTISKLGVILAEVTEQFSRRAGGPPPPRPPPPPQRADPPPPPLTARCWLPASRHDAGHRHDPRRHRRRMCHR